MSTVAVTLWIILALFTRSIVAPDPGDQDPYILCEETIPDADGFFGPWPAGFAPTDYSNALELCSSAWGIQGRNVGCYCTGPNQSPTCWEGLAHPVLWNYQLLHGASFPWLCETSFCYCAQPETVVAYLRNQMRGNAQFTYGGETAAVPLEPDGVVPADDAWVDVSSGSGFSSGGPGDYDGLLCGLDCTSGSDCKPQLGNSCGCKIATSKIVGPFLTLFTSTCKVIGSAGGKRHEDVPCPCNSTYVSHSCCDAEHGLVWEAPEMKLGELEVAHEL